ncbi:MAG: IS110 family transposase [Actinomycetota bacterium]|nr:IS110 family transposase [Actinomycetota bacterium]
MLGVGIDWAESFHVVALGRPGEGVVQVFRVEHDKPAVEALLERLGVLEPDPAEVRVVLETRHGLLVERLLEAGFVVVPVNPDLIARRRGPAKKKDDVEDARIACLLALTASSRCDHSSPTASSLLSCACWAATTNAPARMNAAC